MLGGKKEHHVNGLVHASPTTPLIGPYTSGEILPSYSDVMKSKMSPDVQRPGSGVVGLVWTQTLTWCSLFPPSITFYSEKIGPLCYVTMTS